MCWMKRLRHNAKKYIIIIHGRGPVCISKSWAVFQSQSKPGGKHRDLKLAKFDYLTTSYTSRGDKAEFGC